MSVMGDDPDWWLTYRSEVLPGKPGVPGPVEAEQSVLRGYFVTQNRARRTSLLRGGNQHLGRLVKRWEPDDPPTLADLVERALRDHREGL